MRCEVRGEVLVWCPEVPGKNKNPTLRMWGNMTRDPSCTTTRNQQTMTPEWDCRRVLQTGILVELADRHRILGAPEWGFRGVSQTGLLLELAEQ